MQNDQPAHRVSSRRKTPSAKSLITLFILILLPLTLFGYLAEDVATNEVFSFDAPILLYLHQHASPVTDTAMGWLSWLGSGRALIPFEALIFILLVVNHKHRHAMFWVFAVGGATVLNLLAKQVFARARPDLWISILPEPTFSFPSGHAMQSMAVACGLVALVWTTRWRWPVMILAAVFVPVVGLSRIYLGVHYPSDILAGWAASFAWVIGLRAVFLQPRRTSADDVQAL